MHTTWAGSYARRGKWVFDAYIFRLLFPFLLHRFDCRKKQDERTKVTNEIISNSSFVSSSAFRHSLLAFYFFFQFHDSRSLFGNHEYLCMQHTFMLTHARMYRFHMDLHLSLSLVATSSFSHGSFIGVAFSARCRHTGYSLFVSYPQFYLWIDDDTTDSRFSFFFTIVPDDRHDPLLMGKQGQTLKLILSLCGTRSQTHYLVECTFSSSAWACRGAAHVFCCVIRMSGCSQHGKRCTLNIHLSSSYIRTHGTQNVVRGGRKCKWKIIEKNEWWKRSKYTNFGLNSLSNDGNDEWRAGASVATPK